MTLIINTIDRFQIIIGLLDQKSAFFEFQTENQSDELLAKINQVLEQNNLKNKDINQILVNIGPGSYTGVRVGVTIANALGWSLDVPVFGYKEGELEKVLAEAQKLKPKNFSKPVLPFYQN